MSYETAQAVVGATSVADRTGAREAHRGCCRAESGRGGSDAEPRTRTARSRSDGREDERNRGCLEPKKLVEHPIAGDVSRQARAFLQEHFGDREGIGAQMTVRAPVSGSRTRLPSRSPARPSLGGSSSPGNRPCAFPWPIKDSSWLVPGRSYDHLRRRRHPRSPISQSPSPIGLK